jgi:PIN domain nuclease of toxin-antitoxin system
LRLLLDTHALIWWWLSDPKLSEHARAAIAHEGNETFVSAVSAYEIALKVGAGQLPQMAELLARFSDAAHEDALMHLPLRYDHARTAGLLPLHHRDPFDRLIAAQALMEELMVVTCDPQIAAFGCEVLW